MNLKTKFPQMETTDSESEFRPYFVFSLFVLTTFVLVVVYMMAHYKVPQEMPREVFSFQFSNFPWLSATRQTIGSGLSEFSGRVAESASTTDRLLTLLSLIVMYVVGPTLFFFRWRERRLERMESITSRRTPTLSLMMGAVALLYVVVPIIPASIIQPIAFQNLKQSQATQSSRDELINSLNAIAVNARQYRILPKQLGGGEGTYNGYVLSNEFISTQEGTFTVGASGDKVVLIATSSEDASSRIIVHLDRQGVLSQWNFTGKFSNDVPPSPWRGLRILFLGS